MNIKISLFAVALVVVLAVQAKPQIVQPDIFYEIKKGNFRAVKAWLKTKPDLSVKNEQGQSLLMVAVENKKSNIIKILIKAGVDLNYVDQVGKTALDLAVEQQNHSIAITLFKKGATVVSIHNLQILKRWQKNRGFWFTIGSVIGFVAVAFLVLPGMSAVAVAWMMSVACAPASTSYLAIVSFSLVMGSAVVGGLALTGYVFTLPGKAHRSFSGAKKAEKLLTSATIQV